MHRYMKCPINRVYWSPEIEWYPDGAKIVTRLENINCNNNIYELEYKLSDDVSQGVFYKADIYRQDDDFDTAEVKSDGVVYTKNNKRHRLNGPAVINNNGDYEFWVNGERHRNENEGPTIVCSQMVMYFKNDKLHRLNGPAVKFYNGDVLYYKNGVPYNKAALYKNKNLYLIHN